MDNNNLQLIEKRLVTRFLDMFIRFSLILALASFCFTVFSPFVNMMLWALILAVALYPLHQYFAGLFAGKQGLASVVLVLLGILLIIIPTVLMITSLAESASAMIDRMGSQSFTIPPPSSRIASLPIVGERLSALWMRASVDLPGLLSILASMGGGLIGFIISFIVSGIMMAWGAAGAISAQRIAIRITDENKGVTLTRLCTSTIRAVAQGVIGVALIQALLVGVIMLMASIPAVGIFFILALILGIAQVPVILVTAPAIALMWSLGTHSTGMDIFYTVLLIVAGMADNVLKPLLLGRGVDAPMPVVLLGALGGMASNGILGMFLGATLLAIGYRIFMTWVNEGQPALPQDK
ncbi:TPA: AI-2E family transporter [Klebsiella quasipneumoniae subsp. quasipneumoniae]|nr:AI-2E family transporter [Klebsiella quasipneumoniae subsp. quasipneumoniae]HBR1848542.1 AI-2E family transporter [Klebsiella quasipneumoniae subsp. quasipneumoniae]